MTIRELMRRLAGDDYEWDLDWRMAEQMGPAEVMEVILSGVDQRDRRPFLFRLHLGPRSFRKINRQS